MCHGGNYGLEPPPIIPFFEKKKGVHDVFRYYGIAVLFTGEGKHGSASVKA